MQGGWRWETYEVRLVEGNGGTSCSCRYDDPLQLCRELLRVVFPRVHGMTPVQPE